MTSPEILSLQKRMDELENRISPVEKFFSKLFSVKKTRIKKSREKQLEEIKKSLSI